MEGESSRGPAIAGVVAIALGALLMLASGRNGPVRPQVLGDVIVAATTTVAPPSSPSSAAAPSTTRRATASSRANATTTSAPTTAATSATATTATTIAPDGSTTTSPPTTAAACPVGTPVAEVRTWDAAADGQGLWHVRVSGVVTNRTGATATVDAVAIVIDRIDGSSDDVPADQRPTPYPSSIADHGESTWTWEGVLPTGARPVGADATVAGWHWTDAPDGCS